MQRETQHTLNCHLISNHLPEHTARLIVGHLVQVEFLQLAGVKLLPGLCPVYKWRKEIVLLETQYSKRFFKTNGISEKSSKMFQDKRMLNIARNKRAICSEYISFETMHLTLGLNKISHFKQKF